MKRILMAAVAVLLLSCSGNESCDKTIAVYEDAAAKVLAANSREEFRLLERELNANCSKVLREYAGELAELERKAAAGNKRAVAKLKELNEAKQLYRGNKTEKRAALKTDR